MTGYGSGAYGSGPYGGDTTPGGLPTVHVLLDDGTGTFPYDLTHLDDGTGTFKSYVLLPEGFATNRGRQDWQGGVTAGSLTLTLNNADGRFTPGSTIIASPSPIKVDQRIRITETVNGTTFTRFTGYVKQWPVAWPATVTTWATVQVMATDAQARAERRVLRSVIEEEIDSTSPSAYYPFSEPAGSSQASDITGNHVPFTQQWTGSPVVFGTDIGLETTAATTNQNRWFQTEVVPLDASFIIVFASTDNVAPNYGRLFGVLSEQEGNSYWSLSLKAADGSLNLGGTLWPGPVNTNTVVGSGPYNDGAAHVAALRNVGPHTYDVYIDGVLTNSSVPVPALTLPPILKAGGVNGSIAHFAWWSTAPSHSEFLAMTKSVATHFVGESGTARITRLARYANLPVGTFDTSLTNVAFADITGKSAWEAIQQVADAEGGVVYFDGSGNLTFHNRNQVTTKTAPDLTMDKSYVTPDVQPVHDDQQILNYVEATAEGTQVTQVARSTSSENLHGRYSDSKGYLVQTDAEALDRANWILSNFAEPTTRYGTLTVNLYAMPAATAALTLAALEIDSWLQITDMPSQNPGGGTVDLVVEGYSEQVTASSWTVTLNVVSKSLFDAFVLDDPVRGVLGGGYRLYY